MSTLNKLKNLAVIVVRGHIASETVCAVDNWDPSHCAGLDSIVEPHPHGAPRYRTGRPGIRGKCVGVEFSSCR